jgi:hypothetical protein
VDELREEVGLLIPEKLAGWGHWEPEQDIGWCSRFFPPGFVSLFFLFLFLFWTTLAARRFSWTLMESAMPDIRCVIMYADKK